MVHLNPSGSHAVIGSSDLALKAVDVATGEITTISQGDGYIAHVNFSADGRWMAVPTHEGSVVLWNAKTWKIERKLEGHPGGSASAVFSPDGRTVATTGTDGSLRLWEASSGKLLLTPATGLRKPALVEFGRDGRTILASTGDGRLKIFGMAGDPRPVPDPAPPAPGEGGMDEEGPIIIELDD